MIIENKFKIWWDEDLKIARAQAFGLLDEETARQIKEETDKIRRARQEKLDWLIDLSQMTKATSRARKILVEITADPSINKYAFVGASIFIRTVANFIVAAAGQKNAKHFSTEELALNWMREAE